MADHVIIINSGRDIVTARNAGREMARSLGFGSMDQTRLATAISELTRNVSQHAGSGVCVITDTSDSFMDRLRVVVEDQGPGIANIEIARTQGFSTRNTSGLGLFAVERLVHTFEIETEPGHTRIIVGMGKRRSPGLRRTSPPFSLDSCHL